eukprot:TRINITY_DN26709_c0_g1_i1.p1 TRINITY_DN26709_c0_g1~~TRINITY_DN26709_c0_g1_i1.p1  ORF type:complete len:1908 (-),score=440.52 TRINITY_DN26709_c0_g1_i1:46-5769(-)
MEYATPYDWAASTCSREPTQLGFTYFSSEEVKEVSVVEIDDEATFDECSFPIPGGLHDLELGPVKVGKMAQRSCNTCGMDNDCPGHFGHIEMSAPIYNPFQITSLLKLLRLCCKDCCKLKSHEAVTAQFVRHLQRLDPGELPELQAPVAKGKSAFLSDIGADDPKLNRLVWEIFSEEYEEGCEVKKKKYKPRGIQENKEAAEKLIEDFTAAAQAKDAELLQKAESGAEKQPFVSACLEELRRVVGDFIKGIPDTCARCQVKHKWRKEGHETFFLKEKRTGKEKLVLPGFILSLLQKVWENEGPALRWLVPAGKELGPEVFFLQRILVPPSRFRPPKDGERGSQPSLDRQTRAFHGILLANREVRRSLRKAGEVDPPEEAHLPARMTTDKAIGALQLAVNSMMDSMKSGKNVKLAEGGIRQLLEKKEGLFRMKMMGKRVNFAARSVISPDPNIEPSEIGVPKEIASNLLYPEVATPHNVQWLAKLVERGTRYPGALEVHVPRIDGSKQVVNLAYVKFADRMSLAKQLITDLRSGKPPYTVFRMLQDGDPLLVNRQPTLHKPGIMAHIAKILNKEHTIRLHYVNCNTYNADFDGDEMNLHAPQDPISRMEALAIARADLQYLVPTSGKPLRGLIQDHVIAGSFLTKRDSFYSQEEVCLLLYHGLRNALEGSLEGKFTEEEAERATKQAASKIDEQEGENILKKMQKQQGDNGDLDEEKKHSSSGLDEDGFRNRPWFSPSVQIHAQRMRMELDPPAVLKPRKLWTGKQVLSMLLKHLIRICSRGKNMDTEKGINLDGKSKTPGDIWNGKIDGNKEEAIIVFRGTDLLQGVMDKSSFGAASAGITHMCYELLGGRLVSHWLASIARLFTLLLQMRGFTCAYEDLILRPDIDEVRQGLIKGARKAAKAVAETWLNKHGAGDSLPENPTTEQLSQAAKGLIQDKLAVEHWEGMVIGKMKESWSSMINKCIPIGQKIPVPRNNFASMVQTGAKGSTVNQSQVSCCLGQQELEGRLPPLMGTQRSLPCFAVNDLSNRTRGFIGDRFLTGIRPQEFFFHCMAGREGLVDTAVKTSRSGYLQRCLVKHLENLKVSYDHTIRDGDGSVLQFLYGEDGIDVTRSTYLYKFDELKANFHFLQNPAKATIKQMQASTDAVDTTSADVYMEAWSAAAAGDFKDAIERISGLLAEDVKLDGSAKLSLAQLKSRLKQAKKAKLTKGDHLFEPLASVLGPAHHFGSTSERHEKELQNYISKSGMLRKEAAVFAKSMRLKFQKSLAEPGEAVGVIAAQSMGEPSTQMTLNTFHLAGHGGANVTLGIPRLREIIQTASRSCSTPLMSVPVLGPTQAQKMAAAQALKRKFRKVSVMDCLARMAVAESVRIIEGKATWTYQCRLDFMPLQALQKALPYVNAKTLEACLNSQVGRKLKVELAKLIKESKSSSVKVNKRSKTAVTGEGEDGGEGDVGEEAEEEETGKQKAKTKSKRKGKAKGAEDKLEGAAAEVDEDAEDEEKKIAADDDNASASSGMYSSDEERGGVEDVDEAELAGAAGECEAEDDEENEAEVREMEATAAAKHKKADDEEDDLGEYDTDLDDELSPRAPKAPGGGTGELAEESDKEDEGTGGSGGKPAKRAKLHPAEEQGEELESPSKKQKSATSKPKEAASPAAIKAKKATQHAGVEAQVAEAEKNLQDALDSGQLVWSSSLEGNSMTIIVVHKHAQCPHSLFVGDVLHGILKTVELQDPACLGVNACHVKTEKEEVSLECEGINLHGLQCLSPELVDHSKIYTNDIRKILETFGVEAARASVVKEVRNVFGHYGIEVDHRHLSLIADYMSQGGDLRAFNRLGMLHCTSPLLQMSYETTMQFLSTACQEDLLDNMTSPASAIVLGQPPSVGTGMVSLLVDLDPADPPWKKVKTKFKF